MLKYSPVYGVEEEEEVVEEEEEKNNIGLILL